MNTPSDETAIQELLTTRLMAAWDAGDAKAFASLFTSDADYIVFFGQQIKGRAAIEVEHDNVFRGPLKGSQMYAVVKDIRFLAPNVALAHGEGTTTRGVQKTPPKSRNSIQTYVLIKEDEGWLITAFQNTRIKQGWLFNLIMRMAKPKRPPEPKPN